MILKIFSDVVPVKGKYSCTINASEPVPSYVTQLWKNRGYEPSSVGVARVKFDGNGKEYVYPAYFWSK